MIYLKNTNTNEIEQFSQIPSDYYGEEKETFINENGITCERSKLKDEYIILTENDLEVQEKILLPEIKEKQIALIKEGRKQELDKDHYPTDAFVLEMQLNSEGEQLPGFKFNYSLDENGQKIRKKFKFKLTGGQTALNQPDVIIFVALIHAIKFPNEDDMYTAYSCEFIDGTKGYVAIDEQVADSIAGHLKLRGVRVVAQANIYEKQINSIFISETKTFEEAKAEIGAVKPVFS
jgi:hypothetical protein